MSDPITRRAPGKLFITGEYAVMEPGTPAVLVAVDKLVSATVSATEGPEVTIASDLRPQPARLRWHGSRLDGPSGTAGLSHAVAALEVVAALLAERGAAAPTLNLAISSELHDGGTKFGLGSSGAVTVAVIDAALAYCGVELSADARFRLAMIAAARLDPRASGADLAASTWRGWIAYAAPDRAAVLDLVRAGGITGALRAHWPALSVRRLTAPADLRLAVGWTGQPVSTAELIERPAAGRWRGGPAHRAFVAAMADTVQATIAALEHGDCPAVLAQIRTARRLLTELDEAAGLGIFTDKLTALCVAAESMGAAGKPSGAGGGDCGIALLDDADHVDVERLAARWATAGVRHLPVRIINGETDPHDR